MDRPSPPATLDTPDWSRDPDDLRSALGAGPNGLTSAEAAARLDRYGDNAVGDGRQASALKLLASQFRNPLVLILVAGAVFSLLAGQWIDAWLVLAIVLGSALLGFFQEYRASEAVAKLRQSLALKCKVRRNGKIETIAASTVVPGDLVLLSAGSLVPADGVVLDAEDFLVSDSALTGESFPVEKRPSPVPVNLSIPQRSNAVYLGTSVRSGQATVLVTKTGASTAYAAIAASLTRREPESEFARGLRQFGGLMFRVMVVMLLFVMTVNVALGRPPIELLLFAVALAVGLTPELLPAIVSVTLAAGARLMAASGVIVRRLQAIENLGSMDVLCTDKTGTITEGVVSLAAAVDPDGTDSSETRRLAFLNAAFETGIENPLDAAIVEAGEAAGLNIEGFTKLDEIPYDFLRKRLTIVVAHEGEEERWIVTKGAFTDVLAICTSVVAGAAAMPLDPAIRERLDAYYAGQGTRGLSGSRRRSEEICAEA